MLNPEVIPGFDVCWWQTGGGGGVFEKVVVDDEKKYKRRKKNWKWKNKGEQALVVDLDQCAAFIYIYILYTNK